jgi:ABC-type uncharacterized transport system permease subunit
MRPEHGPRIRMIQFLGLSACLFYLAALTSQLFALHEGPGRTRAARMARLLGAPALALHLASILPAMVSSGGIDFGLFKAASLFFWTVATLVYLASFRAPLGNLQLIVYPLTVVALLTALFLHTPHASPTQLGGGLGLHILLSILAYSILSVAAVQSAALGLLINRLKHRRLHGVVDLMPPLATMETLLFRLIWTGEALLAAAILTGALFIEDMFAQHLAHKTVLSIIAWTVFAILLWGRHRLGWRGLTAIRWTLAGFGLLILGYFGSKFVLQVLLAPG